MEIKRVDSYRCDECEETFFMQFDKYTKFCPYCGHDDLTYASEAKMVADE